MTDETNNQTVFTQTPESTAVTQPASQPTFTLPQEVNEFVGNGKKYSSVEDALKSVPHAQKHISTLEQELAQVKAELDKRKTTEQLLEEIKNSGIPQVATTTQNGIDHNTVQQMIAQTLSQAETEKTAKANISVVTSTFQTKFGDKAEEFYIKLAKETGLSVQHLNNLSATSPSAVLKLAGLDSKPSVPTNTKPTFGSINTEAFNATNSGTQEQSARVRQGATTKELVNAWKIAGAKVGKI